MQFQNKICLLPVLIMLAVSQSYSQQDSSLFRIGAGYEAGKQPFFPFTSPDYTYSVKGYKVLFNYRIKETGSFSYELQIEPGIYSARHRLLNEYFIQPDRGSDYLEQREIFKREKIITEYVLNIGFQVRYALKGKLSLFASGSIGPMISGTETERLAKGFAFADVIALGIAYKVRKVMLEIRPGLRHVSNANLQHPNSGHNSSNLDFGISYSI
jgi:Lipid A 3-O-deacylase (PagL)